MRGSFRGPYVEREDHLAISWLCKSSQESENMIRWGCGAPRQRAVPPHSVELVSSPEGGDGNWVGASRIAVLNRFSVGLKSHLLDCLYWRGTLGHFNGFSALYISVWPHPIAHFVY